MSAPERTDAEIEKHRNHNRSGQKGAMIGPMCPAHARAPKHWRKYDYRQQKKYAHYLKPQNPPHASEGTQKTTQAFYSAAAGLADCAAHGPRA